MAHAPAREAGPSVSAARRRPVRIASTRPGLLVLSVGAATFVAGCYRAAVELTQGRLRPLVPVATDAPLAAELLVLVAVMLLTAAALLLAAAHRSTRR